jgi:hypothetical protein
MKGVTENNRFANGSLDQQTDSDYIFFFADVKNQIRSPGFGPTAMEAYSFSCMRTGWKLLALPTECRMLRIFSMLH